MRLNPSALTDFREARFVSKSEMAKILQISLSYYCDLESGHRPGTPALIERIADVLKIRPLSLIENPNDDQRVSA
jgi:transcriptional regulator with XRE-family HTH domain